MTKRLTIANICIYMNKQIYKSHILIHKQLTMYIYIFSYTLFFYTIYIYV